MSKTEHKRWALVDFRNSKRMTQDEFIEQLGVTRANYSMIERGTRDGSLQFWSKLQKVFGVPDAEMWALIKNDKLGAWFMQEQEKYDVLIKVLIEKIKKQEDEIFFQNIQLANLKKKLGEIERNEWKWYYNNW